MLDQQIPVNLTKEQVQKDQEIMMKQNEEFQKMMAEKKA